MYNILIKFGVPRKLIILIKKWLDGTQSKVRIGNYLSSSFPIENSLKQGDALSPLLSNFVLEYAIKEGTGLNLNGTHQVLTYVDDVNLIEESILKFYLYLLSSLPPPCYLEAFSPEVFILVRRKKYKKCITYSIRIQLEITI